MTMEYHLMHSLTAGESKTASRNPQCDIERDGDKKEVIERQD